MEWLKRTLQKYQSVSLLDWIVENFSVSRNMLPTKYLKACFCYFLSNFYFSPNDSSSKTIKNVFDFIWKALFILEIFKFLSFCLPLFFPVSHCFIGWFKKNLKIYNVMICLNKNLITCFVLYLEEEIRCDISIWISAQKPSAK